MKSRQKFGITIETSVYAACSRWLLLPLPDVPSLQLLWHSHSWHALKNLLSRGWGGNETEASTITELWRGQTSYDEVKIKRNEILRKHMQSCIKIWMGLKTSQRAGRTSWAWGNVRSKAGQQRWLFVKAARKRLKLRHKGSSVWSKKDQRKKHVKVLWRQAVLETMLLTALWII